MPDRAIFTVESEPVTTHFQFAGLLMAVRHAAGLSQAQVAARLGVSASTITYREAGKRHVTVADAMIHLKACGYQLVLAKIRETP